MEDSKRFWTFWAVAGLLAIVSITGLVIAISANNNAVDENQVVKDTATQLKGQLNGLGGALKLAKEQATKNNEQAARDRAKIKGLIGVALTRLNKRIGQINSSVGGLQKQVATLQKTVTEQGNTINTQGKSINGLNGQVQDMQAQVNNLAKKVRRTSGGGSP